MRHVLCTVSCENISSEFTSVFRWAARFVSPPEISPLDGRTVFLAVKVSPRVIVAIRHSVVVAILRTRNVNLKPSQSAKTPDIFYDWSRFCFYYFPYFFRPSTIPYMSRTLLRSVLDTTFLSKSRWVPPKKKKKYIYTISIYKYINLYIFIFYIISNSMEDFLKIGIFKFSTRFREYHYNISIYYNNIFCSHKTSRKVTVIIRHNRLLLSGITIIDYIWCFENISTLNAAAVIPIAETTISVV